MTQRVMSGCVIREGGTVRTTVAALTRDGSMEAVRVIASERRTSWLPEEDPTRAAREEALLMALQARNRMLAEKARTAMPKRRRMDGIVRGCAVVYATARWGIPAWARRHRRALEDSVEWGAILVSTVLWSVGIAKLLVLWGWVR